MSLRECKECGHSVSTKARKCPNCGATIKKSHLFLWIFLLLVVCGFIYHLYSDYKQYVKTDLEQEIKSWINDKLKISPHCTSVSLVRESSDKYTGFAEFEGGERVGVAVTTDANETVLMRLKGRPKADYEQQVKTWINDESEWSKELRLRCTSVYLIKESSGKYTGYVEMETGERIGVVVTVDSTGEAMFELNRADAFMLGIKKNIEGPF